eukprot:190774_1
MQLILLFLALWLKMAHRIDAVAIEVDGAGGVELILNQKDIGVTAFSIAVRTSYLENEDDSDANTFTNIGSLDPAAYVFDDGYYYFKMVYDDTVELLWKQTSWLLQDTITGFTGIDLPPTSYHDYRCETFKGLGLSNHVSECFLDGSGSGSCWWNCAGSISYWIPGYNGQKAYSAALYVYLPGGDVCDGVECDDEDLCTLDYCDPETGDCVFEDITDTCADTDSCTIDTCDSSVGCVNTPLDCADGNICNGEEACVDGACVSPDDFECAEGFTCNVVAQDCLRDCSLFAIDGFLRDCSVEFDDQSNQLVALEDALIDISVSVSDIDGRVTENENNIGTNTDAISSLDGRATELETSVSTNTDNIETNRANVETNTGAISDNLSNIGVNAADIATNAGAIGVNVDTIADNAEGVADNAANIESNSGLIEANAASIETNAGGIVTKGEEIDSLDTRLTELEDRVHSFTPLSEKGEGNGGNSLNGPNEAGSDAGSVAIFDLSQFEDKDNLIRLLMAINVMFLVAFVIMGICWCRGEKSAVYIGGKKYSAVNAYSSADDEHSHLKE